MNCDGKIPEPSRQQDLRSLLLRRFLSIYWLRPETALWRTLDCLALEGVEFQTPILDVGCGDGLFSFTRAGGVVSGDFDMYLQVRDLDRFFSGSDIYDSFTEDIQPVVENPCRYRIALGVDQKGTLLRKAYSLGCYDKVCEWEAGQCLPVPNRSMSTIFSNMLYWVEDVASVLSEFHRALATNGACVLCVPNGTFREYSFYQRLCIQPKNERFRWLQRLDRGRSESIRHCLAKHEWIDHFTAVNFEVVHHRNYLSKTVLEIWDIGLRPLSPLLIEMANGLPPERRRTIKGKWIDIVLPFLEPLCELSFDEDEISPPGFHLFVLKKREESKG